MSNIDQNDNLGGSLTGAISTEYSLTGTLSLQYIPCEIDVSDREEYEGKYVVSPRAFEEQVLHTEGKVMKSDVTVKQVPYFETSNESGNTIYIGMEID